MGAIVILVIYRKLIFVCRRWIFTYNNPPDQMQEEDFVRMKARFMIVGYEVSESGTPHLQGYVEFNSPVRFNYVREHIGILAHFDIARGDANSNIEYCSKDGDFESWGEWPTVGQGKRNDILRMRDAVRAGADNLELFEDDVTCIPAVKYTRGLEALRTAYSKPVSRPDIHVELWFGDSCTGKSSSAMELYPEAYWKENDQWWPLYHGQTTVVWDEFTGEGCTPTMFNKLCDKYPMNIQYKGGSVAMLATTIIIISNYTPGTWWDGKTRVNMRALTRRFHKIRWFKELGVESTQFDNYSDFSSAVAGIAPL